MLFRRGQQAKRAINPAVVRERLLACAARIALAPPIKTKPACFFGAQAAAMAAEEENRRIEAANRENFMAAWELLPPWAKEVTEGFRDCEHIGWGSAVENLKYWIDRMMSS